MQLVELQRSVATDPGVALAGISYDPVPVLADFSEANGIEFPLLSDVGSLIMDELGMLSDVTDEDLRYWGFEKGERHAGLPFPGVILLDRHGVVTDKRFERSHRNRMSGPLLLGALGREPSASDGVVDQAAVSGLAVRARVTEKAVFPNQVFRIAVDLVVEDGRHLYVDPCPPGYQVLHIALEGPDGVFWDPAPIPEGHSMKIDSLGETFQVLDGAIATSIDAHIHESVEDAELTVVVDFQTCDEMSCDIPARVRLRLPLVLLPKI
jgi:AhpC/TSA family